MRFFFISGYVGPRPFEDALACGSYPRREFLVDFIRSRLDIQGRIVIMSMTELTKSDYETWTE